MEVARYALRPRPHDCLDSDELAFRLCLIMAYQPDTSQVDELDTLFLIVDSCRLAIYCVFVQHIEGGELAVLPSSDYTCSDHEDCCPTP